MSMSEDKDSRVIFLNKQEHKFKSEDIMKALKFANEHRTQVWAIQTPYGIFQPMDAEEFDNVYSAVMGGPAEEPTPDDLL